MLLEVAIECVIWGFLLDYCCWNWGLFGFFVPLNSGEFVIRSVLILPSSLTTLMVCGAWEGASGLQ